MEHQAESHARTVRLFTNVRVNDRIRGRIRRRDMLNSAYVRQYEQPEYEILTIEPREKGAFIPKQRVTCFRSGCIVPDIHVSWYAARKTYVNDRPTGAMGVGASMISKLGTCSSICFSCSSYCLRSPDGYVSFLMPARIVSVTILCNLAVSEHMDCSGTKVRLTVLTFTAPFPWGLHSL